ncbi:probable membrane protein [Aquitalea magnusonii]|uniref:Probable membrane protein n=1 Tax=Aquitalea magnusonii TaxID=332411 RepID=A0A3G9GIF3_9NEIS|nr:ImcF-related family protein [Aquitalea magnusonii]BBF86449.1 probable membrane protein [Aquitalea magnusonii]
MNSSLLQPTGKLRIWAVVLALSLMLLCMALLLIANLYLGGFYTKQPERLVWSIGLCIALLSLPSVVVYLWIKQAERQAIPSEHLSGRTAADAFAPPDVKAWLSPRQYMQQRYPGKWRAIKPWVGVLHTAQTDVSDPRTSDASIHAAWQDTESVFYVKPDYGMKDRALQGLRGRWRPPLDGVMLVAPTLPDVGSPALQQLLDFNQRSGWRLPLCLALSGWTVPADGVVCQIRDASNTEAITRDLQQLAWQLAVQGQADVLQQSSDNQRLALSAALDQPGIIEQLTQQLHAISQQLPPGQPLVQLGWVAEGAAVLPTAEARSWQQYSPRRHRLSHSDKAGWAVTAMAGLLLLGVALSFQHNFQLIQQAKQQRQALQQATSLSVALPALATVQQQISQLQQTQRQGLPWWWRLGLNQLPAVQQALLDGYGQAARRWLVEPVRQNLRQVLLALNELPLTSSDNAMLQRAQQQGYASLKAYLMLDQPARAQPAFLTAQLQQADGLAQGRRAALLGFYSQQLPTQAGWRLPADPALVAAARQTLLSLNGIEHDDATLYQTILTQAAAKYPPRSAASLLPGVDSRGLFNLPGVLSGVYTREAWEGYLKEAFEQADPKQGSEAGWVLGVTSSKSEGPVLPQRLRQRYFADYAAAWQAFLNRLHWQNTTSLAAASEQLNAYADPQRSPLQALMAMLQYQGRAGAAEKSLAGNLLDKTRQLVGKTTTSAQQTATDPLTAAFGPLLALSVPPDGNNAGNTTPASSVSLTRYLETLTAVRLKLQQLAASPNPDAAARQLAQALFQGRQNEISDGQKYAALLAASLGQEWAGFAQQAFVSPLDEAGAVVLLPAAADINALWRRSIVLPWGSEMSGRYPFNSTDNDAAIPALGRYLAPLQGEIARFLQQTLGGALVQEGDQWLPSPNLANAAPFDAAFLNAVNSLSRLASRWFAEGDAGYSFELQPVAMPGLVRTELTVDGQTVSYFNQQASWNALRWPGHAQQPGSQLVWESLQAGSRQTLAFNGRWAFIRLLEQAKVEQLDKARYQLDFALPDGLTARYILRTSAADGPLALLKLRQFSLPERVFVLPGTQAQSPAKAAN